MPRPRRTNQGGLVSHVLNRANGRQTIFRSTADYEAFERVLAEAIDRVRMRLLSYCIMPNHWHMVLWPRNDGDLSNFLRWLTVTHTQRWHVAHGTAGTGHLDQGRFKNFIIQNDRHLWRACRYVERNAQRAGLVKRAEDWRWGSARRHASADIENYLSDWPVPRPYNWLKFVNSRQTEAELEALRVCARRGSPFGDRGWTSRSITDYKLGSTVRLPGRPRMSGHDS